ncbi:MAG: hypothetical protein WAV50_00875 [Minisyncoccia bacterium]
MRVVQRAVIRGRIQFTSFRFGPRSKQISFRLIAAQEKALAEEAVVPLSPDFKGSDPAEIAKLLGEIKEGQIQRKE